MYLHRQWQKINNLFAENKDVDIDKFKALVNKITNLMPKFFEIFFVKEFKISKIGKIIYKF